MKKLALVAGLALSQAVAFAQPVAANSASKMHPRPPANFQGQWYTTPGKCSYSRAQAPGYAVQWVLILNPHHIGQPPATKRCPARL